MQDLKKRLSRMLARRFSTKPLKLTPGVGVVSFTFDDAPASACLQGAEVLQAHNCRGTYYIAGGLTDHQEQGRDCHSRPQLLTLREHGHELGCHGWSHMAYDRSSAEVFKQELDQNAAFLESLGVARDSLNFAYPFGAYSYGAKQVCAPRFQSCRITGNGLHRGAVDLTMLGSYRLYGDTVTPEHWQPAIAATASAAATEGGWLIVNTHEVDAEHGPYGCSPETLDNMVSAALAAGCVVLPVAGAIAHWRELANKARR